MRIISQSNMCDIIKMVTFLVLVGTTRVSGSDEMMRIQKKRFANRFNDIPEAEDFYRERWRMESSEENQDEDESEKRIKFCEALGENRFANKFRPENADYKFEPKERRFAYKTNAQRFQEIFKDDQDEDDLLWNNYPKKYFTDQFSKKFVINEYVNEPAVYDPSGIIREQNKYTQSKIHVEKPNASNSTALKSIDQERKSRYFQNLDIQENQCQRNFEEQRYQEEYKIFRKRQTEASRKGFAHVLTCENARRLKILKGMVQDCLAKGDSETAKRKARTYYDDFKLFGTHKRKHGVLTSRNPCMQCRYLLELYDGKEAEWFQMMIKTEPEDNEELLRKLKQDLDRHPMQVPEENHTIEMAEDDLANFIALETARPSNTGCIDEV